MWKSLKAPTNCIVSIPAPPSTPVAGVAESLDPVECFRLAVGEPDPWQKTLLRSDPRLTEADRMVLALCGSQSGKSTSAGGLWYDDFSVGKTVILTAPDLPLRISSYFN